MTLFGSNLLIIAKELDIPIDNLATYRFNDSMSVTLYNTEHVGVFLNLPPNVYSNYNAWFQLPGEWSRHYSETREFTIKGQAFQLPLGPFNMNVKTVWPDIFTYLNKIYARNIIEALSVRVFDLLYTGARINERTLLDFLNETAVLW